MRKCSMCNESFDRQEIPDDVTWICKDCLKMLKDFIEKYNLGDKLVGEGLEMFDSQEV